MLNVPTVDMGPENGSIELWPGTHLDTTISVHHDIKIPADVVERRRGQVPPVQPRVRRGAILIRDVRLWHAGMPNRSNAPRPMIAMIHNARWLETGTRLRFPVGTEAFFEGSDLSAPRAHKYAR